MPRFFYQNEVRNIGYKGQFLDTSKFFTEFSQGEMFSQGLCLTLSILLGELIKGQKKPTHLLFNYISQNASEIKGNLTKTDKLLSSVHKKQNSYNKKININFFSHNLDKNFNVFDLWGDFTRQQLTDSIDTISKQLFANDNFKIVKNWYILNEISRQNTIYNQINNQLSRMAESLNDYRGRKGLFIVSFSFGLFIKKDSKPAIVSYAGRNFHKDIEVASSKNHSCLLYISGDSFLFFDPNIGIVNQDIRNIESFFSYLYAYYDLVNTDENVFFFHEIEMN
ncbi:hypothetical protein EDC55_11213 [Allofrancisella inopinata]|uniref:Virulence surface antigen n=1 Tax=Allofrancisella inopinata TaxID=1085647 RepID=A0AAE7CR30_9GAMM|nr:hypothetical protein [Allofrancisella inopinata]QIV96556.1 hypothetical protein E4K63_06835 [Allofrancisella inopinata]TDT71326.1 hypothetical protein EDC55_11213 [Allofrancisella inopinata]